MTANRRYFADLANGATLELKKVYHQGPKASEDGKRPAGLIGFDYDAMIWRQITRRVEYKAFAIKHECDARCTGATGRIMKCECACGGKNHGKGSISIACEAA